MWSFWAHLLGSPASNPKDFGRLSARLPGLKYPRYQRVQVPNSWFLWPHGILGPEFSNMGHLGPPGVREQDLDPEVGNILAQKRARKARILHPLKVHVGTTMQCSKQASQKEPRHLNQYSSVIGPSIYPNQPHRSLIVPIGLGGPLLPRLEIPIYELWSKLLIRSLVAT